MRGWKIMAFGLLFIAFLFGIVGNHKSAKSKVESEEKISKEILRLIYSIHRERVSIRTRNLESFLNKISTQKSSEFAGRRSNCHFAMWKGTRWPSQGDRVTCDLNLTIPLLEVNVGMVAIFDGQSKFTSSEMASNMFLDKLMHNLNNSIEPSSSSKLKELLKSSLEKTIIDIDEELSEVARKHNLSPRSTAVVALIYDNHLLVAHVGNSKAFLCSHKKLSHQAASKGTASLGGFVAKELTIDHNARRLDERARIEAFGAIKYFYNHYFFPMTRAIGDIHFKRFGVIANPDMTDWLSLTSKDEFLVVSSNGIFERNSTNPQAVCDFLYEVDDHSDPSLLAQQLIDKAYSRGIKDDLSVVLVPFGSSG